MRRERLGAPVAAHPRLVAVLVSALVRVPHFSPTRFGATDSPRATDHGPRTKWPCPLSQKWPLPPTTSAAHNHDMTQHLYEPAVAAEIKQRIARLRPDSPRQWGRMTPAQALAHCVSSLDMALGRSNPPRMLVGYIFSGIAKRSLLARGEPMRRNSPTSRDLRIRDDRDFGTESKRLVAAIDEFVRGGPSACTTHPHTFFGPLTPLEWATLMYQHLDHHLRQFGV